MPLRDHFRPPVDARHSWAGFLAMWPAMALRHLNDVLPEGYRGEPRVHLGTVLENDLFERDPEMPGQDIYELRIFGEPRRLVASIHFASPSNKEPSDHVEAFVAKCAELLSQGVCVSIVDLVTIRKANLYTRLLDRIGRTDPAFPPPPPPIYAVTLRKRPGTGRPAVETWAFPLAVGSPLPTLPIWLDADRRIPLNLEASYTEACRVLQIR